MISDGEFGKPGWLYITTRLSGFEAREIERPKVGFRGWDAEGRFREFYDATPPLRSAAHPPDGLRRPRELHG